MKPKFGCCEVETVCGRNLWQAVVFVGISTLVISTVILLTSVGFIISMTKSDEQFNSHPMIAINLVLALVSTALSCYQIVISLLLLWQAYRNKNKIILCSLWYVSHLSILTIYCLIYTWKTVVCFREKYYLSAIITMVLAAVYTAFYSYFAIIVNSYLHSVAEERYF